MGKVMDLLQQNGLAANPSFQNRVMSAVVTAAISVTNETANEVHTLSLLSGTASGGTFTLTYGGQTTAAIAWNATAGTIQLALQALTSIGTGNVFCSGGPFPGTPVVITFIGTLAGTPLNLTTVANSLTGSSPVPQVVRTTTGVGVVNHAARQALASKVLANPASYAQIFSQGAAANVTVQGDFEGTDGAFTPINGAVTGATNATPIVITSANHGLTTGNLVNITGVGGDTAANGTGLTVTVTGANTFSINGSVGNGAYTSGGTWNLSETQIKNDLQFTVNSIFSSYT